MKPNPGYTAEDQEIGKARLEKLRLAFLPELKVADRALEALHKKLADAPLEDWHASLAVEVIAEIRAEFYNNMGKIFETPRKPENFQHWRDKYAAYAPTTMTSLN